jgi:hypothetical protein
LIVQQLLDAVGPVLVVGGERVEDRRAAVEHYADRPRRLLDCEVPAAVSLGIDGPAGSAPSDRVDLALVEYVPGEDRRSVVQGAVAKFVGRQQLAVAGQADVDLAENHEEYQREQHQQCYEQYFFLE